MYDSIEIEEKINSGVFQLMQKRKGKSEIWTIFAQILKDDQTILDGFVCCRNCKKIYKYNGKQSSNLNRHKCFNLISSSTPIKSISEEDKQEAIDACTTWVIEDYRPFAAIEGTGFLKVANFFLKIGARYGTNIELNDLLPDPSTLSRRITKTAQEIETNNLDESDSKTVVEDEHIGLNSEYKSNRHCKKRKTMSELEERLDGVKNLLDSRLRQKSSYDWLGTQVIFEINRLKNKKIQRDTVWKIQQILREASVQDEETGAETHSNSSTILSQDSSMGGNIGTFLSQESSFVSYSSQNEPSCSRVRPPSQSMDDSIIPCSFVPVLQSQASADNFNNKPSIIETENSFNTTQQNMSSLTDTYMYATSYDTCPDGEIKIEVKSEVLSDDI